VSALNEVEDKKAPISVGDVGGDGAQRSGPHSHRARAASSYIDPGFIDIRIWFGKGGFGLATRQFLVSKQELVHALNAMAYLETG
jgi:hypothetical protein